MRIPLYDQMPTYSVSVLYAYGWNLGTTIGRHCIYSNFVVKKMKKMRMVKIGSGKGDVVIFMNVKSMKGGLSEIKIIKCY